MNDARAIANSLLDVAAVRHKTLTNLQIQKLVYLAHGHFLRATGKQLCNEQFEAWDFGPVSRTLYNSLKKYGDGLILQRIEAFDPIKVSMKAIPLVSDPIASSIIGKVFDVYGSWSAFDLVELTHSFGSPWSRTMELARTKANLGMKIDNNNIEKNFEGLDIDAKEIDEDANSKKVFKVSSH